MHLNHLQHHIGHPVHLPNWYFQGPITHAPRYKLLSVSISNVTYQIVPRLNPLRYIPAVGSHHVDAQ